MQLGRYSEAFGPDLLPGMYSSPVHAVDKPGTTTFRLINDQSAGEFSPNSMIDSEDVAGTCMDGIKSLGASLHAFRCDDGSVFGVKQTIYLRLPGPVPGQGVA